VQLIPDHKGVAVENGKRNCPMVVGRTNHNEEMAEHSKTQIPEDKRQRRNKNPAQSSIHGS